MCLAVPGQVVATEERDGIPMAKVDFGGVVKDVCLAYLPDIEVGDYAVVHVGFALQRLDEESALATLELFRRIGALEEEFGDAWERAAAEAGPADGAGALARTPRAQEADAPPGGAPPDGSTAPATPPDGSTAPVTPPDGASPTAAPPRAGAHARIAEGTR
ncbi:hypothetical protein GCM10018793_60080 [Streptomyces sulfonofaciens]|uniref:HypC/HybG/HupF family hydrogenase formation chaperone n=1 Tax=Streptomyces sulfonofaciens TaxID=68272 RepID=A0A919GN78_9ACTN|nr:hypothetical protein GCM10018793_60080 [Streptomyces sulfonofaciens]